MKSEETIFAEATGIEDPEARAAYLEQACGGDAALRQQVDGLLAAHDRAGGFMQSRAPIPGVTPSADLSGSSPTVGADLEPVGATVGPYKLLERIGEGGMGVVYMADQAHPVRRRVALKIIKPGMDSRQVIARFEAERQALAMMDHPSIARVLDAGTTDAGRPYFAMELVKGVPITEYCDANHLTPRERLGLFVQVSQAVQHAHTKGVIHRDLKPTNILVTLHDGVPVPKVIDFGIAKATGGAAQQLTDKTLFTNFAQMIGTPLYMSPEQAELSGLDVDTRSDIYSLGVLLYELLTGTTPFDKKRLGEAALDEMRRIIREEEPPRPSTRLSTLHGETLTAVSANRKTEPGKLGRSMRGELDWIVMKSLEKDRTRRYETAAGLALDVQRYLADEPVQACPPSAGYKLRKFARRNRGPVLAGGLVLLALVAGIAGTTVGMARARRSATAARADREQAVKDKAQAEKRLAQIEKSNAILASVFADLDPGAEKEGMPLRAVLGERLAGAAEQLEGEAVGDPVVVARLQLELGRSMVGLGMAERAIPLYAKARATLTSHLGPDHAYTLSSMHSMAWAYLKVGKFDLALPLAEETLRRAKAKLGPDHRETLSVMGTLASAYDGAGRFDLAVPLYEETVKLTTAKLGADHFETLRHMGHLAIVYGHAGKLDLAVSLNEKTLELKKAKLGHDHPHTLAVMHNLATAYERAGNRDQARSLYEKALELTRAKLGPDHPNTLDIMGSLAIAYVHAGKLDLAVSLNEKTLELQKAKLGHDHPATLLTMNNLAFAYDKAGNRDQALPLYEKALELTRAKLGPDHPQTLRVMDNLASAYNGAGKRDQALPLYEELVKLTTAKLGADHFDTLRHMRNLAIAYHHAGKLDLAMSLNEKTLELTKAKLGGDHPDTLAVMHNLASAYYKAGKLDLALALYEKALELTKAKLGPDHPETLSVMGTLASAYDDAGKLDLALPLYEKALELTRAKLGADHPQTLSLMGNLAVTYDVTGRRDLALPLYEKTLELTKAKLGPDHRATLNIMGNLAMAYGDAGRMDLALPLLEKTLELKQAKLGPDHPDTLKTAGGFSHLCMREAWRLSLRPPAAPDEPARALEFARKAMALRLVGSGNWAVLGWAEYRCGNWKAAVEALEKSCAMHNDPPGGDPPDWMFLAMAHWQLGDKDLAGAWYTLGSRQGNPGGPDVGMRAEVAGLLGLPAQWPPADWKPGPADVRVYALLAKLHPQSAWPARERLVARRASGQVEEAAAEALQSLERLAADAGGAAARRAYCRELAGWDEVFQKVAAARGNGVAGDGVAGDLDLWLQRGAVLGERITAADADPARRAERLAEIARCHEQASGIAALMRQQPDGRPPTPAAKKELEAVVAKLGSWEATLAESKEPAGPFRTAPAAVPGTVQAEDFDRGGIGSAYADLSLENIGSRYRKTAVDLSGCKDEGGGHNVGGVWEGEWLAYTVDVAEAGLYDLDLRVSSPGGGGTLHLEFDRKDVTGAIEVPKTGGWDNWTTVTKKGVSVGKGRQVLRVVFDAASLSPLGGDGGHVCNLNWVRFTKSAAADPIKKGPGAGDQGAMTKGPGAGTRGR